MSFHVRELWLTSRIELLELLSGKAVYTPDDDNKLDTGAADDEDAPKASKQKNKNAKTTKSTTRAADEEDAPKAAKQRKTRSTKSTIRAADEEDAPKAPKQRNTGTTKPTKPKTRKKDPERWLELIPDDDDMVGQASGPSTSGVPLMSDGQIAQPHTLSSLTFS
jgi:hypothetical protein